MAGAWSHSTNGTAPKTDRRRTLVDLDDLRTFLTPLLPTAMLAACAARRAQVTSPGVASHGGNQCHGERGAATA